VLTDGCILAVGWAPRDAVADALAAFDAAESEAVRRLPGSDTNLWSLAFFGETVASAHVSRDELRAADLEELEARIPAPPPPPPRESGGIQIFFCGPDRRCDHDYDGPELVEFAYGDGNPSSGACTCSKCGIDAMSVSLWGAY
jgi:hypothetical protein